MSTREEFNSRLGRSFAQARQALSREVGSFVEELGMSADRYRRILWGLERPTVAEIDALARVTGAHVDLIYSGQLDFETLGRHARADHGAVPERYTLPNQQLARARAVQVIYEYLRMFEGEQYAHEVLGRIQLDSRGFSDATASINPLIVQDLLMELKKDGLTDGQIRSVGTMTLAVNRPFFEASLAGKLDPGALYEFVHEELLRKHYDRIHEYKLKKLTHDGCIATIETREEAKDAFKADHVGTRVLCHFRQGVYMSFLANVLPRYAKIEESSCMFDGAERCTIHASWN